MTEPTISSPVSVPRRRQSVRDQKQVRASDRGTRAIVGICYTYDQPDWQKNVLRLWIFSSMDCAIGPPNVAGAKNSMSACMAVWRARRADLGLALMSGPFPPPWSVEEAVLPSSPDRMPPNGRGIREVSRGRPTSRRQINRTPLVPVGPVASFPHRRRRAGARLCLF